MPPSSDPPITGLIDLPMRCQANLGQYAQCKLRVNHPEEKHRYEKKQGESTFVIEWGVE